MSRLPCFCVMVVIMRYVRFAAAAGRRRSCAAPASSSRPSSTVKADGSGTIDQRLLFTQAAVAQLRQFAALSGGGRTSIRCPSNRPATRPRRLGAGVTYVSSTVINSSEGVGRDIKYAFTDINKLSLDQAPPPPGGMPAPPPGADRASACPFKLTRQADGRSLLTIARARAAGARRRHAPGHHPPSRSR